MLSRLTGLGWALVAVLAVTIIAAVTIVASSDRPPASRHSTPGRPSAQPPPAPQADVQRVFDAYDALDYVQLTYDEYLAAIQREPPGSRPAAPYELNQMLLRLEQVRPRLSPNLYQSLRAAYTQAAINGRIGQDALLCAAVDVDGVMPSLRLGGSNSVVVAVQTTAAGRTVGQHEVTVSLESRRITAVNCPS